MNIESSSTEIATGFATEFATLGGGCFWCLDAVFERLHGVVEVVSGYAGGHVNNPSYQAVCDGDTGHAEVVQIRFHPGQINYRELLDVFFAIHDPTTPNRQGNDVGTQYRSVIFTHSDLQAQAARQVIAELKAAATFAKPVVTQVLPVPTFWPAETYHQGYFARNDRQPYCQIVVGPKVAKFRDKFRHALKDGR
jgi:peptide-methionine (S)-S-oxide reductase